MEQKQWQERVSSKFASLEGLLENRGNKPKRKELPDFTGELHHDAIEWLELAQKLLAYSGIETKSTDNEIPKAVLWMSLSLTGTAHVWYNSLDRATLENFVEFIKAFKFFFVCVDVAQNVADFHRRIQLPTESVAQFYLALQ